MILTFNRLQPVQTHPGANLLEVQVGPRPGRRGVGQMVAYWIQPRRTGTFNRASKGVSLDVGCLLYTSDAADE